MKIYSGNDLRLFNLGFNTGISWDYNWIPVGYPNPGEPEKELHGRIIHPDEAWQNGFNQGFHLRCEDNDFWEWWRTYRGIGYYCQYISEKTED